jgi:hypothetical protein
MSTVSKRTTVAMMVVGALVVGGAIGFVWHVPGRPRTWDDARTWLTFAVLILGLPTALYQLNLQRLQLRDQQAVIKADAERSKRRDELLDKQLQELEQRVLMTERAQAEQVEFSWRASRPIDESREGAGDIWMGVVENRSRRPIRDIVCRLQPHPAQDFDFPGVAVGELSGVYVGAHLPDLVNPKLADRVPLIRGGRTYGFKTQIPVADHQVARMMVRFTDDALINWEIDSDLHLAKLQSRNW